MARVAFRRRWGSHNVRTHAGWTKHYRHHVVGDLDLAYETMDLRGEPGLSMTNFSAEPGSPTAEAGEPWYEPTRASPLRARCGGQPRTVTVKTIQAIDLELLKVGDPSRSGEGQLAHLGPPDELCPFAHRVGLIELCIGSVELR